MKVSVGTASFTVDGIDIGCGHGAAGQSLMVVREVFLLACQETSRICWPVMLGRMQKARQLIVAS